MKSEIFNDGGFCLLDFFVYLLNYEDFCLRDDMQNFFKDHQTVTDNSQIGLQS